MTLWKRQYRVKFPELKLEYANTLRISFDVTKDITKETNKSKLTLFNLSDESRQKIEIADRKVEIYAGYKDNGGAVRLFVGTVVSSSTKNDGTTTSTELSLSDGQGPIRDTAFTLSFAPGTPVDTVVQYIADEMGVPVVYGEGVEFDTFKNGYSFVGVARDALDGICKTFDWIWSIQNEVLQILLKGGVFANRGLVFAADSGLIGSPERVTEANPKPDKEPAKRKRKRKEGKELPQRKSGWKIKTLLAPTLTPGDLVKVDSKIVSGWFKVESVQHKGDTHSGDWTSEIKLIDRNAPLTALDTSVPGEAGAGAAAGTGAEGYEAGCEAVYESQGGYVSEGCVYRLTQAGSYWSPYLKQECENGNWSVDALVDHAPAGSVISYDPSQLEKGDTIVFYSPDHSDGHVGAYDGAGGMWHNSYSHQGWYHQGSLDMGNQYPEYIIKTSRV